MESISLFGLGYVGAVTAACLASRGHRIVGVDPESIGAAWDEIRLGAWPPGRLPALWDGKTAERIVRALLQ